MSFSVAQMIGPWGRPSRRVVQEGLGDVGGDEVVGELRLALDAAEIDLAVLDDLPHGVVRTDLALEISG